MVRTVRLAGGIPEWKLYSSFHRIVERLGSPARVYEGTRAASCSPDSVFLLLDGGHAPFNTHDWIALSVVLPDSDREVQVRSLDLFHVDISGIPPSLVCAEWNARKNARGVD